MGTESEPGELMYVSESERACRERAIVLAAAGIGSSVQRSVQGFHLVVPVRDAQLAAAELAAYAQENQAAAIDAPAALEQKGSWAGVACFASVLLIVAVAEQEGVFGADWVAAGRADAAAIHQGQLWRAVTALTLHADMLHLAGNLMLGGVLGYLASQAFGAGLAWMTILTAGALGNWLNTWVRNSGFASMGASTAVFAALGLLAAHAWYQRRRVSARGLVRWAPIVGGMVLLSVLGTGGARTDVGGHVAGFGLGAVCGALFGRFAPSRVPGRSVQGLLGLMTASIVAIAWWAALG